MDTLRPGQRRRETSRTSIMISVKALMILGVTTAVMTTNNALGDRFMAMALPSDTASSNIQMATVSGYDKLDDLRRIPFVRASSGKDTTIEEGLRRSWTIFDDPSTPNTKSAYVRVIWVDVWGVTNEATVMTVLHQKRRVAGATI